MEKWIISEVMSYLFSTKLSYLQKLVLRKNLWKTKRQLKKLIEENILRLYGNDLYYHDFDNFMCENRFIERILSDLYQTGMGQYKSVDYYVKLIAEKFIEKFPQYGIYKSTCSQIIYMIFKYVFDSLNRCEDDNVRIIINNTKEICFELDNQIKTIASQNKNIQQDIKKLIEIQKLSSDKVITIENEDVKMGLKLYKQSLQSLFWDKEKYIQRAIEGEENKKVVDSLVENKKIMLLGEPGCGKTIETLMVLEEVSTNEKFEQIIPIYISLNEYGIAYNNIQEGILTKLELYIPNINKSLINQLITSGKILLILDGADEIYSLEKRNEFYFDINKILALKEIQVLLTSRRNQYHGTAKNIKEISITKIDRKDIDRILREAGVYGKIFNELYELFTYPLFLEIGIAVLKKNPGRIYNKSQLFAEYISMLFYNRELEKGITQTSKKGLFETVSTISKVAFYHFDKLSFSLIDFDEILSGTDFTHANICELFRIDIFFVDSGVRYIHKQFKEYLAAFYLVKNIPIEKNIDVYKDLMTQEEWQEVLVFASGICEEIEEQNCLLDNLIKYNLKTYIRCVRLKNDLATKLNKYSHEEYSKYYLKTIFESYITIINVYFPNLRNSFNPQMGKKLEILSEKKACILGELSENKKHLTYWFDWRDPEEETVQLLEGRGKETFEDMEKRAILERRNISTYGINLERSGYQGDSARAIAIERIKKDLENILEKRKLLEDNFLLCERLSCFKKKLNFIKTSTSIEEMYYSVKSYIDKIYEEYNKMDTDGELEGIENNGVDMVTLLKILEILYINKVEYEENILPGPNQVPQGAEHCGWVWEYYSNEQILNVVEKFFSQVVISFKTIVEQNFPLMKDYFYMIKDFSLKYKVQVEFNRGEGFASEPGLSYYYISTTENDLKPEVTLGKKKNILWEEAFSEISSSYIRNGKEIKNLSVTDTGFTMCINERSGKYNESPVAGFIYKKLQEEFKNLFDK